MPDGLIDQLLAKKTSRPAADTYGPVKDWFRQTFGTDIPTRNLGQSEFETKAGHAHERAFDVGLHPNSKQGQALINYLNSQGIPYSAFDRPITRNGVIIATGPHIHVGPPSKRIGSQPAAPESVVDRLLRKKSQPSAPESVVDKLIREKGGEKGPSSMAGASVSGESATSKSRLESLGSTTRWAAESLATGAADVADAMAGAKIFSPITAATDYVLPKVLGKKSASKQFGDIATTLRKEAAVSQDKAGRSEASKFGQEIVSGAVATTPEMVLMALGVPAPLAFGMGSAAKAAGKGEDFKHVVLEGAKGAALGRLFKYAPSKSSSILARIGKGISVLGLGSGAIELAFGGDWESAAKNAAVMALLGGLGGLKRIKGAPAMALPEEAALRTEVRTGVAPAPKIDPKVETIAREGMAKAGVSQTAIEEAVRPRVTLPEVPKPRTQPARTETAAILPEALDAKPAARMQIDLILDSAIKQGVGEVTIPIPEKNATREGIQKVIDHIESRGLSASTDGKFVLVRGFRELARPSGVSELTSTATRPPVEGEASKQAKADSSVLINADDIAGSGKHDLAQTVLRNKEWTNVVLRAVGEGGYQLRIPPDEAVGDPFGNRLYFQKDNGEIISVRIAYQGDTPTIGTAGDGLVIEVIKPASSPLLEPTAKDRVTLPEPPNVSRVTSATPAESTTKTSGTDLADGVEMRHAGLDPIAAIRAADDLTIHSGGFKANRNIIEDFSTIDRFKSPLSNLDFVGYMERIGGDVGKKASDALRRAQVNIDENFHRWQTDVSSIGQYLERARGAAKKPKFYEDFIDLVEKKFDDPTRTSTNPDVMKALETHDKLTKDFKDYIIDTRAQLGIEMPPGWGITERGYFRHLFLGDIQIFEVRNGQRHFKKTASTYAEAQKTALDLIKENPNIEIIAKPRTGFSGDSTVRLSTKKFWKTVNELVKSTRGSGATLTKADILEDVRGTIGQQRSKQKQFGALKQRAGYEGFSKDYLNVMEAHAAQLARTQELSKLNRELVPLIEKMKAEGKPGLAEDAKNLLDGLWGVPTPSEVSFGNMVRKTPVLRNYVANPDMAMRGLANRLTRIQTVLRLDFNVRASVVNAFDPLTTLWPYTSSRDFAALYAEYLKPSTRQMLRERGVLQGATKLEAGTAVKKQSTVAQRVREVGQAEGFRAKAGAVMDIPPRPFRAASDVNRGIGYLFGLKDGARRGLNGEPLHRYGLEWAKKVEFDNSLWNVAPILRSPLGRVLGQFKGYPLKQLENIHTLAKKQEGISRGTRALRVGKFLGAKLAVGGVKAAASPVRVIGGLLGYEVVVGLSNQLQQYGMNKDVADKMAQTVYYGAPALIGQDLSASVAIMDDFYGSTPEEKIINFGAGPTVSGLLGAYKARTPEQFMSKVSPYTRGASTIAEMAENKGRATVPGGRGERIELSPFESVMRVLGFTPLEQSQHFDTGKSVKQELKDPLKKRVRGGDQSALQEALDLQRSGKLTEADVTEIRDASFRSDLYHKFSKLPLGKAEEMYKGLTPEQQQEVRQLLQDKRGRKGIYVTLPEPPKTTSPARP